MSDLLYVAQGTMLALSYSLPVALVGQLLLLYERKLAGTVILIAGFWTFFLFLLDFSVFYPPLSVQEQALILPMFLVEESIVLAYFSSKAVRNGSLYYSGLMIGNLSESMFVASLGYAAFEYSPLRAFSYFFIPVAVTLFFLSFSAPLMKSRHDGASTLGRYLARSSGRLTGISVWIGILLLIYEYPKPAYLDSYILLAVLLIAVILIVRISWKTYSATSSKIWRTSNEIYSKHKHSDVLLPDNSLNAAMDAVNEFVRKGEKEKLIVTLTMILTNSGFSVEECNSVMRSLISYKIPDALIFKTFAVKSRLEREIRLRDQIVKEVVSSINRAGAAS